MPELGDLKWNLRHSVQNSSYHMLLFQCSCLLFSSTLPLAHTYSDSSGPHSRTLHKIRTLGQRNTQGIGHKYCRSRGLRETEVQPCDTFIKFPPFSGHSVSHWGTKCINIYVQEFSSYCFYDQKNQKQKAGNNPNS